MFIVPIYTGRNLRERPMYRKCYRLNYIFTLKFSIVTYSILYAILEAILPHKEFFSWELVNWD